MRGTPLTRTQDGEGVFSTYLRTKGGVNPPYSGMSCNFSESPVLVRLRKVVSGVRRSRVDRVGLMVFHISWIYESEDESSLPFYPRVCHPSAVIREEGRRHNVTVFLPDLSRWFGLSFLYLRLCTVVL